VTEPIPAGVSDFFILQNVEEPPPVAAAIISSVLHLRHPVHGDCAEITLKTSRGKSIVVVLPVNTFGQITELFSVPF